MWAVLWHLFETTCNLICGVLLEAEQDFLRKIFEPHDYWWHWVSQNHCWLYHGKPSEKYKVRFPCSAYFLKKHLIFIMDQRNPSYGSSAVMTVPWPVGSMASKTETKHSQLHFYRNLTSRTLHRSFAVSDSNGMAIMAIYSGPRPVSNLSQTFRFLALDGKEGQWRHGFNVWRLMSINVA